MSEEDACLSSCTGLSQSQLNHGSPGNPPHQSSPITNFPETVQVFLLQAILRGQQYPRTRAAYDVLAAAGQPWDKLVAAPLARIDEDPLFRVAEGWALPGFQERLAGKKIPLPRATSVESMLCAHGNRRVTWHAIFECGEVTAKQVKWWGKWWVAVRLFRKESDRGLFGRVRVWRGCVWVGGTWSSACT